MSESVTVEQLKGNYGEHLASQVLSRFCLIRPVAGNTDIGIDLYCESVIKGKPFLHFWVQVKSEKDFPDEQEAFSYSFKTKHLRYWRRQPVPVLAFLVPTKWPPESINYIHVIDITSNILVTGIKDQSSQSFATNPYLSLPIKDIEKLDISLEKLLLYNIPMTVSAMYSAEGFLREAPKPEKEYIKYFSADILSRCLPKIDERMKYAATFGIEQFLDSGGDLNLVPKSLIAVLNSIEDKNHHYVFKARGRFYEASGANEEAIFNYEEAIDCIRRDPNSNETKSPWRETISAIDLRLQNLQTIKKT
jgi:hypothetical protein